jgi:hypothetical protein
VRTLRLHARTVGPAGAVVSLRSNGAVVAQGTGVELWHDATGRELAGPTMFRVEVEVPRRGRRRLAPAILSNGIFVGARGEAAGGEVAVGSPREVTPGAPLDLLAAGPATTWAVERDPRSRGAFARTEADGPLAFTFALAADDKNAWSALRVSLGQPGGRGAVLRLRGRATRPLRLSVQVRASAEQADLRWRRSVYLDETTRTADVPVDLMAPVRRAVPERERPRANELLLVIDRVNTTPGSTGTIWIEGLELRR